MTSPRTTCGECGEEIWGADEVHGVCVRCRREADESEPYDSNPELWSYPYIDDLDPDEETPW